MHADAIPCLTLFVACASFAGGQITAPPPPAPSSSVAASAPAAAPARPADMPPTPPHISCFDDQLTIAAENATLGSIFAEVQRCIGVRIDLPEDSSANDRVYLHLGPGPARVVLLSLLDSTDFNYILQPSASDPNQVESVLLTARTQDTKEDPSARQPSMNAGRRAWFEAQRQHRSSANSGEESSGSAQTEADPTASAALAPTAADTPRTDPAPAAAAQAAAPVDTSGDKTPASPAGTPDTAVSTDSAATGTESDPARQLQHQITSMQQLFEQRQQMIQGQSGPPDKGATEPASSPQ